MKSIRSTTGLSEVMQNNETEYSSTTTTISPLYSRFLWIPYLVLAVGMIMCLLVSFIRFHRRRREVIEAQLFRENLRNGIRLPQISQINQTATKKSTPNTRLTQQLVVTRYPPKTSHSSIRSKPPEWSTARRNSVISASARLGQMLIARDNESTTSLTATMEGPFGSCREPKDNRHSLGSLTTSSPEQFKRSSSIFPEAKSPTKRRYRHFAGGIYMLARTNTSRDEASASRIESPDKTGFSHWL